MTSTLTGLGSLVLALVLIPACGGGKKVSPTLFSESFNSGFPTTNWTAPVVTGSATAAVDLASGFPAPSLKMSTTAATSSVKTDSTASFTNPSVAVTAAMANLSGAATEQGSGSVSILDATPAVVASATWSNTTGLITFHINGGAANATVAAAADGNFHRLVFNVSGAGTATWSFDGGAALVTQAGFFFDEITVTSP